MALETAVRETEPEVIRADIEASRTTFAERMETFEQGVKDTWQGATTAVADTIEGVRETVGTTAQAVQDAVHGTTEAMQEAVHGTTQALGWALDIPAHVRRYPWLMMAGAILLGMAVGTLVSRERR